MNTIERILNLMNDQNINAHQLEKSNGLAVSSIQAWKSGKAKPSADALTKLADYFNVSTDYLLGRTNEKKPMETFPISFDVFESGLIERGITKNDIEKLSPEQSKLLFDMLEQFIKTFKDKN